jgi:preprotein translocase subunit SecF
MVFWGFNFGIDFKGGSVLEVSYSEQRPSMEEVKTSLSVLNMGAYTLQPVGDNSYMIRTKELNNSEKNSLFNAMTLQGKSQGTIEQFNSVGPVVGNELKSKAIVAIVLVIAFIVLFITFAFRKVSHPVSSWKYGLATVIALAHDVVVPTGIFIVWIHFMGGEIDLLFVTAILAILGYSVHDTIVVFDRIRENLRINKDSGLKEKFDQVVGKSLTQTMGRSINTSLTIFLVLLALFFFGAEVTRNFSFVLLVGIVAGTYSSIFLASPILVWLEGLQNKKA